MDWHTGKMCGEKLTIQVMEGRDLSAQDTGVVRDFFSEKRVYKQDSRAVVWLAYWSPLTRQPRTMRVVHYESLKVDDVEEDLEARAADIARKIFDTPDVETTYVRSDNGEAWLSASCNYEAFVNRMLTR